MTKVYIAEFLYGELDIVEVEKVKDTPKQIRIDKKSIKILWKAGIYTHLYLSEHLRKDSYSIFDTQEEAVAWGIKECKKYLAALENKIFKTEANINAVMTHFNLSPSEELEETQELQVVDAN